MSSSPSHSPLSSARMEREEAKEEAMRMKAAFHYAVGKTCDQMGKKLTENSMQMNAQMDPFGATTTMTAASSSSSSSSSSIRFSKKFISAVSELAWRQLTSIYAKDLETFARHAKRQTITEADVMLIARHNPALEAKLNVKSVELASSRQTNRPANKRKATAGSTSGAGGPSKKSKTGLK